MQQLQDTPAPTEEGGIDYNAVFINLRTYFLGKCGTTVPNGDMKTQAEMLYEKLEADFKAVQALDYSYKQCFSYAVRQSGIAIGDLEDGDTMTAFITQYNSAITDNTTSLESSGGTEQHVVDRARGNSADNSELGGGYKA